MNNINQIIGALSSKDLEMRALGIVWAEQLDAKYSRALLKDMRSTRKEKRFSKKVWDIVNRMVANQEINELKTKTLPRCSLQNFI